MVCESWAMWAVSTGACRGYLTDMWNIFGINAIFLTAITNFLNTHDSKARHGLNAFVVGLLWIKVLAFLKVVNKDMATFILALSQILFDIRFFLLVMAVCVFLFGDMFHIAMTRKGNGSFCEEEHHKDDNGTTQDFCTSSWSSYLRVYVSRGNTLSYYYNAGKEIPTRFHASLTKANFWKSKNCDFALL